MLKERSDLHNVLGLLLINTLEIQTNILNECQVNVEDQMERKP
jgi:hypothetical protein